MSGSEFLIKTVQNALEHETIEKTTREAIEALIDAYRETMKACLRLEETIHKIRKED